jgi:hypothetical protein
MIPINGIAQKQEKVGTLSTNHVKDRIASRPSAALAIASKISAPGKSQRHGRAGSG